MAIHYPSFGGPSNLVIRLHTRLLARGWETTVVLPTEPGDADQRLGDAGVDLLKMPLSRLRATPNPRAHLRLAAAFPRDVAALRAVIRRLRPDVAVVSGLVNPHLAVAAAREGVAVVWQMIDNVVPGLARRLMMLYVLRLATVIMFDGEALKRIYLGGRATRVPTFVYYPPVDCSLFVPSESRRIATRNTLGIPQDAPLVGTVANFSPQKGILDFITSASVIHRTIPDAWFLMVGAPLPTHLALFEEIKKRISESGVPRERFILAGGRNDVERYYPAMDVKVISSHTESTTTTAMEAMACGVPVVATDVGGVREVVRAGTTGLMVPPRNPIALAGACMEILLAPSRASSMSARARDVAVAEFDVTRCLETQLDAYRAAIARNNRRGTPGR